MEKEQLIPADEFCANHQIAISFISSLHDSGLINIISIEERTFIPTEELSQLEKIIRLHFEMDINVEGIETIIHLLDQMQQLQQEMNSLKNKLRFYEL
ncbi:MAG: chaperone modulator CbpM [Ferruginibacter sp.]